MIEVETCAEAADSQVVGLQRLSTDFQRPVFCLLGLAFDQVDMSTVVDRVGHSARQRIRMVMSTPNVNNIVAIQQDAVFRDAITRCDLVIADGMPLVWIARLLGISTCRVAGSDLFQALMRGEGGPLRVYFFGAAEGMAEAACERLNRDGGPMRGAGWHYPGFGTVAEMAATDVVARINVAQPDFVVVALGTAKGQQWIQRVGPALDAPLISHLGAVVNFVAGSVRRAPMAMQRSGFEWVWRIREEPALWRRYAKDAWALAGLCLRSVLPLTVRRVLRSVLPVHSSAKLELSTVGGCTQQLTLSGNWLPTDLARLRDALTTMTEQNGDVIIDARALGSVDHTFIGLLIRLYGHQHQRALRLVIDRPNAAFARQLRWHCADYLLASLPSSMQAPTRKASA